MGVGHPPHQWSEHIATLARSLAMYGVPIKDIAVQAKIGETTLEKYYRKELDEGKAMATAKLTQTAYRLAVDEKNVTMLIFLMKTRLGYRETDKTQEQGVEPKNIQIRPKVKGKKKGDAVPADPE